MSENCENCEKVKYCPIPSEIIKELDRKSNNNPTLALIAIELAKDTFKQMFGDEGNVVHLVNYLKKHYRDKLITSTINMN